MYVCVCVCVCMYMCVGAKSQKENFYVKRKRKSMCFETNISLLRMIDIK